MQSNAELQNFYATTLQSRLLDLEAFRKQTGNFTVFAILGLVAAILLGIFMPGIYKLALLAPVGGMIYSIVKATQTWKVYKSRFKEEVVQEVVHFIHPEWEFYPKDHISPQEYHRSGLFKKGVDRYNGDDLIVGKIETTDFRCSELHTEYKTTSSDGDGNQKTEWHTIFKGLFFHGDFHKHFSGQTYVLPDYSEKLFGNFGRNFQRLGRREDLLKMDNVAFEKEFAIYSTDPIEARYILTPTMMEAMLRLQKDLKTKVHFSFVDTRVFCAISFSSNLMEPRFSKSGVKFEDIEKIYDIIKINEKIVRELDLNTRIWSKD